MSTHEQLTLPADVLSITREVYWFAAVQFEKKRRLLANKVISQLIIDEKDQMPKAVRIDAGTIGVIKDPNLRYALRFADAAEAAGWVEDSAGCLGGHFVSTEATDEGVNSRFIGANYTGVTGRGTDTFLENLHRFSAGYDENHSD